MTANSLLNGSLNIDDEQESDTENNILNTMRVSKDKANEEKEKTNNRRELINNMLKEQKDKGLARKRGRGDIGTQLLDLVREENTASNKMFAHVEQMGKEYSNHMQRLTTTMETLSNSIQHHKQIAINNNGQHSTTYNFRVHLTCSSLTQDIIQVLQHQVALLHCKKEWLHPQRVKTFMRNNFNNFNTNYSENLNQHHVIEETQ